MSTAKCKCCGALFDCTGSEAAYCPACSSASRAATVLRPRTCRACGATFTGGPRAWYCPSCRAKRQTEASLRCKRSGPARPLGSTDTCTVCGKPYTVASGRQRYCPACAAEATKAAIRPHKAAYMAGRAEQSAARKRDLRAGRRVCCICGGLIPAGREADTCGPDCAKEYKYRQQVAADLKRGKRKSGPHPAHPPQSGVPGVTWHNGRWQLKLHGKYIGIYDTVEAAKAARDAAEQK